MIQNLKLTVLMDNIAQEPLVCEWGLSMLFGPDGLHPNAAGAKVIAEAVFRTLCNHPGKEPDEQEMR